MFETIVALATPPLKSALAIIRLSGDDCFDVVGKIVKIDVKQINKNQFKFLSIYDEENKVDEVVALFYKAPHSFTGEDSVEIISHGSMLIANQIIELLIKNGARMATNGEFSSRAFMHGKIDLIQAEAINDMINATTKESKNISLLALDKKVSEKIIPFKTKLADLLSLIAVNIDYPEYEDIEQVNKEKIINECTLILKDVKSLLKDSHKSLIIKEGLKVAIIGKPNVGKSSLLNAFISEEKAIVTDIAGTTRDIVEGEANINGVTLRFLDTAGIRDSEDYVENIGIKRSKQAVEEADIVIVVLSNGEIDKEDEEIISLVDENKRIIVNNKSDIKKYEKVINVSAKYNDINDLKKAIIQKIGIGENDYKIPALNNTRQIGLLESIKIGLLETIDQAKEDTAIDLINYTLLHTYKLVLEILGEENQIDMVKEIFSRFCVGK